ncbi:MAG: efflux RND transporter periplasmic adaptor subunit [Xanthomonadales bacterium]|nr:efflux RND transporter periplasmic adaptor subunit [Xanthomonadales bacterium]
MNDRSMLRPWGQQLAIAVLACLFLTACSESVTAPQTADRPEAAVIRVSGQLQSANSRFFAPPSIQDIWNYKISFLAPDGQAIAAGKPVLGFDTQELKTRLRDKNNELNEKRKELERVQIVATEQLAELSLAVEEASADLDKARLKADIPANLLAARDYRENQLLLRRAELELALRREELARERDVQATEVEILEREVAVLQADAERLQDSIRRMVILAPADGVVIHVRDRRGNKTTVGDNVWGGRRVIEFPDLTKLEAHLEIPERSAAQLRLGQQVRFTVDAAPDKQFIGEITELASVIHTRSASQPDKVFDATVQLLNPDTELMRPGMNINAEILLDPVRPEVAEL